MQSLDLPLATTLDILFACMQQEIHFGFQLLEELKCIASVPQLFISDVATQRLGDFT